VIKRFNDYNKTIMMERRAMSHDRNPIIEEMLAKNYGCIHGPSDFYYYSLSTVKPKELLSTCK